MAPASRYFAKSHDRARVRIVQRENDQLKKWSRSCKMIWENSKTDAQALILNHQKSGGKIMDENNFAKKPIVYSNLAGAQLVEHAIKRNEAVLSKHRSPYSQHEKIYWSIS